MSYKYKDVPIEDLTKDCIPGSKEISHKHANNIQDTLKMAAANLHSRPDKLATAIEIEKIRSEMEAHLRSHSRGSCGFTWHGGEELAAKLLMRAQNLVGPGTITPEEEMEILSATLPLPEIEESFIQRNFMPLVIGGSVLTLGVLGFVILIKI